MDRNASTASSPRLEKPDEVLRRLRSKLGITAGEVEELTREISQKQEDEEFIISHGRIIQVENNESMPSIYKLCSLSAIYGIPLNEMVSMFGDLDALATHRVSATRHGWFASRRRVLARPCNFRCGLIQAFVSTVPICFPGWFRHGEKFR